MASAVVSAAPVRVFGTITLNDKRPNDLAVTFYQENAALGTKITVHTDANGLYDARLPSVGKFLVNFRINGSVLLGHDETIDVVNGDNERDWTLRGGVINLSFSGWDYSSPLMLRLGRLNMIRSGTASIVVGVSPEMLPMRLEGLAFGQYAIEARHEVQTGQDKLARAIVTLDSDHTEQAVQLNLKEQHTVIKVVDQAGHPVTGAMARSGRGAEYVAQNEPGTIVINNIPPGIPLTISAGGFVPACRALPAAADLRVVLDRGIRVRLRFSGTAAGSYPPGALKIGSDDCLLMLRDFEYRRLGETSDGKAEFLVTNFPGTTNAVFVPGALSSSDQQQRINFGVDGVCTFECSRRAGVGPLRFVGTGESSEP